MSGKTRWFIGTWNIGEVDEAQAIRVWFKKVLDLFHLVRAEYIEGALQFDEASRYFYISLKVHFRNPIVQVKSLPDQCNIQPATAAQANADDFYIANNRTPIDGPRKFGDQPMVGVQKHLRPKQESVDYEYMWQMAKDGNLEMIPAQERIKFYGALRSIAHDYLKTPPDKRDVTGYWVVGDVGVGKSSWVRSEITSYGLTFYNKDTHTKFWEGYDKEPCVIFDDFDATSFAAIGTYLKTWADTFGIKAETKGGSVHLVANLFVVTSNYDIGTIYGKKDLTLAEAIRRRFITIHFPNFKTRTVSQVQVGTNSILRTRDSNQVGLANTIIGKFIEKDLNEVGCDVSAQLDPSMLYRVPRDVHFDEWQNKVEKAAPKSQKRIWLQTRITDWKSDKDLEECKRLGPYQDEFTHPQPGPPMENYAKSIQEEWIAKVHNNLWNPPQDDPDLLCMDSNMSAPVIMNDLDKNRIEWELCHHSTAIRSSKEVWMKTDLKKRARNIKKDLSHIANEIESKALEDNRNDPTIDKEEGELRLEKALKDLDSENQGKHDYELEMWREKFNEWTLPLFKKGLKLIGPSISISEIPDSASSLIRAFGHHIYGEQPLRIHWIRHQICEALTLLGTEMISNLELWLPSNSALPLDKRFEMYIYEQRNPDAPSGYLEIEALSFAFQVEIMVMTCPESLYLISPLSIFGNKAPLVTKTIADFLEVTSRMYNPQVPKIIRIGCISWQTKVIYLPIEEIPPRTLQPQL